VATVCDISHFAVHITVIRGRPSNCKSRQTVRSNDHLKYLDS